MNSLKACIYFMEPEVIEGVLPNWPQEIRLALCLYKSGRCEVMVFHCHEGQKIISRMQDILKLEEGSFGVVPQTEGYPTKAIRFSDQQHFLKLILEQENLCEVASDYAINYRFAEEEGLDPIYFTNRLYKGKTPSGSPMAKSDGTVLHFESRRRNSKDVVPMRDWRSDKKAPRITTSYVGNFAEIARIEKSGSQILLTLNPDSAEAGIITFRTTGVIHIEEANQFLLERPLFPNWNAGKSAVVEMPVDLLSCKFPPTFFDTPRLAVVMIVPKDIFVTCGPEIPTEELAVDTMRPENYPFLVSNRRKITYPEAQNWQ